MSETQAAEVVDEGSTAPDTVEVSAVLTHDISHVWHVLSTNDGVAAFLGEGAKLGNKGEHWQAADGTHGVWRSYHPMEQVRLSWHADADAPRSLVDLHLAPQGEQTFVSIPRTGERRRGDARAALDRGARPARRGRRLLRPRAPFRPPAGYGEVRGIPAAFT